MRGRGIATFVCLLALLAGAKARGAEPAELRALFPQEARVFVEGDGLSRLVLPPEILAACRPDLSDLRLFDADGRETAFLVDAGRLPEGVAESIVQRVDPRLVEAGREEIRRESGPPLRRESFELAMPAAAPQTGNWVLIVETRAAELVARVQVDGIGADGEAKALIADGSIFRLGGPLPVAKVRLPLPPFQGPRLRVVLETEQPFWLEPAFRLESARELERGGRIAVPLEILSIRGSEGRTVVDLERPRGIVPGLLRVETSTGTFDRKVEVWDAGPGSAEEALGSGRVFRVEALSFAGEDEVALSPARGDRLRVEIDDGDSPALRDLAFAAVIRQPSLVFSLKAGRPGEAVGTLRFGGGRARAPRYDLTRLLPQAGATGKRAEAAALLYDDSVVRPARLGPVGDNPDYDGTPLLAFAMRPGAEVDQRLFSHVRELNVPASPEGLSRLRLEPEDLAVLRDDLGDVRVAADGWLQWPYLLEHEALTDFVPLEIEGPRRSDGTSRYELRLPVSPLRFDRVLLETDAGYFDRAFRLEAEVGDADEVVLARGRLVRPIGDPRPATIDVTPSRAEALRLVVEDGDDAPLEFSAVRARVPLPALYLAAPEGRYSLLLGAPDEDAPRYELERVREVVLAVRAVPIEAGPLEENTELSLQARLQGRGFRQNVLLWSALILAVIVLAWLTLRMAWREGKG